MKANEALMARQKALVEKAKELGIQVTNQSEEELKKQIDDNDDAVAKQKKLDQDYVDQKLADLKFQGEQEYIVAQQKIALAKATAESVHKSYMLGTEQTLQNEAARNKRQLREVEGLAFAAIRGEKIGKGIAGLERDIEEHGGGGFDVRGLLAQILQAMLRGQTINVDGNELGRTTGMFQQDSSRLLARFGAF